MDSIVPDGVIVAFQRINDVMDLLGNLQLGQLHDMSQRVIALYGHDAWKNGTVDADGATVVDKLFERGCLEEQLCDYEISACVDFLPGLEKKIIFEFLFSFCLLEMEKIIFVALSFRMSSGIT